MSLCPDGQKRSLNRLTLRCCICSALLRSSPKHPSALASCRRRRRRCRHRSCGQSQPVRSQADAVVEQLHDAAAHSTHPPRSLPAPTMASTKPLTMLARGPSAATLLRASHCAPGRFPSPATVAFFSTTGRRAATPAGPPPPGFRLPRPKRWDEGEGALDRAGKYFLLLEMFRGMYVSLEQFFRPP
jgi:hypothetical protein